MEHLKVLLIKETKVSRILNGAQSFVLLMLSVGRDLSIIFEDKVLFLITDRFTV